MDPTPRKDINATVPSLKVISWNVDGIRAPGRREAFAAIIKAESPDVMFLQETKLQDKDVEEWKDAIPGYTSYWTCSQKSVKLGYAGCAAFVKQSLVDAGGDSASGGGDKKISHFFAKKTTEKKVDGGGVVSVSYGIGPANEKFGVGTKVMDCHGDTDSAGRFTCRTRPSLDKLVRLI